MTFLEFIRDVGPKYCECPSPVAYGRMVELAFNSEVSGDLVLSAEKFRSPRERAMFAVPYLGRCDLEKVLHVVDAVELAIVCHRQRKHGDDCKKRIEILSSRYAESGLAELVSVDIVTQDWWNG